MSKSILPSCVVSFRLIPYLASPVNVGKGPLPTKREAKGSTGKVYDTLAVFGNMWDQNIGRYNKLGTAPTNSKP